MIRSYRKEYDKVQGANKVTVVDEKGKDAGATFVPANEEGDAAAETFFQAQCDAHNGPAVLAPAEKDEAPAKRSR